MVELPEKKSITISLSDVANCTQMDDEVIIQFEPNTHESKGVWFASNRAYDVQVGTQRGSETRS
ncbi:MAG: hypothetical protein KBG68_05065 [Prevotella sp.]|nr:hypothetical protein [Prevotella sp.]